MCFQFDCILHKFDAADIVTHSTSFFDLVIQSSWQLDNLEDYVELKLQVGCGSYVRTWIL